MLSFRFFTGAVCAVLALITFLPSVAWAQDGLDTGDTAWILISTGLVLFHDDSRLGNVLRRSGSNSQRAIGFHALLWHHGRCHRDLDRCRATAWHFLRVAPLSGIFPKPC